MVWGIPQMTSAPLQRGDFEGIARKNMFRGMQIVYNLYTNCIRFDRWHELVHRILERAVKSLSAHTICPQQAEGPIVYKLYTICMHIVCAAYKLYTICIQSGQTTIGCVFRGRRAQLYTGCIQIVYKLYTTGAPVVYNLYTFCIRIVYNLYTIGHLGMQSVYNLHTLGTQSLPPTGTRGGITRGTLTKQDLALKLLPQHSD